MPVPPAPTALVLLPVLLLIVAAARTLRARRLPAPDVYEPGHHLSPAEAADIEADLDPIYLPHTDGPTQPATTGPHADAAAFLAAADAAEARLGQRHRALDEQLARTYRLMPDTVPAPQRAPHPVPAHAFPGEEPTA